MKRHTVKRIERAAFTHIDFLGNRRDLRVVLLGMLGFAARHIAAETGYTEGQVNYRLGKAGVKVTDYRYGRSATAKAVQKRAEMEFGKFLATVVSDATDRKVVAKNGVLYLQ